MLAIRARLFAWYSHEAAKGVDLTKLEDLTPAMIGAREKPELSAKGAETKCLIPFCVDLVEQFLPVLGAKGKAFLRCGRALLSFIDTMSTAGWRMTRREQQTLAEAATNFLRFWDLTGLVYKPKAHQLVHTVHDVPFSGNPSFHTTFLDESENRVLADISRAARKTVFWYRVFGHFESLAKIKVARKRRRVS